MPKTISPKIRREAIRDHLSNEMTLRAVSSKYGISYETARRWVDKGQRVNERKNFRKDNTAPNANQRWTRTEDELLKSALEDGLSLKDTVSVLGRTNTSIYTRKSYLTAKGIIPKDATFKSPSRGRRVRRSTNAQPALRPAPMTREALDSFGLSELAALVKEHGMTVTLIMGEQGTEVKIHN